MVVKVGVGMQKYKMTVLFMKLNNLSDCVGQLIWVKFTPANFNTLGTCLSYKS